ncbi:MAG: hypothetical protein HQ534_13070 [Armatimonadetes bacterium]|nr:hypothetical protein [Armatimonadota bacterium]
MKSKFFFILLIIFLVLSCSKTQQKKYAEDITFYVDTLLTEIIRDDSIIDIQVAVPKGWEKISDDNIRTLQKNMKSKNNIIKDISPLFACKDSLNSNIFYVSIYNGLENLDTFIDIYKNDIKEELKSDKMKIDYFSNNELNICQIMIYNADLLNLKLILKPSNRIYVIDYLVTMDYYNKNLRTIESSIGQLKRR